MNKNEEIEVLTRDLKPYLRRYLEMQGVRFARGNQYHCFNAIEHKNGDKKASASITKDNLGYKCFTCGISGDIIKACNHFEGKGIKGVEFIETLKYLADMFNVTHDLTSGYQKQTKKKTKYIKETEYIYTDINNKPIYKIVRMVNPDDKKDKQFYPHMYDEFNKNYKAKSGFSEDCKREIYNIVEVNQAIDKKEYIFFVEGEKCVEILRSLGLPSTCISNGAMGWKKPHSNHYVTSVCNAKVIILPDNDVPGRKFAEQVARDISATTELVKIVELEDLPLKGDIEQWLRIEGNTKERLLEISEKAQCFTNDKQSDINEGNVYKKDNRYYRRGKDSDKKISNFVIIPHERIEEDGMQYFFTTVMTDQKRPNNNFTMNFSSEVFINRTLFKKAFQNTNFYFIGGDDDLQDIKILVSQEDFHCKQGVKFLGMHKVLDDYIFVSNEKSLTKDNIEDDSTILMPQYKVIETNILEHDIITKEELKLILKPLCNFNSPDKTATILGYILSCCIKPHLLELGIGFPHLLLFGEAGSGKTQTVEKVIKPFFDIEHSFSVDQLTPFTTMKICCSSNVIPFIIEEYKPRKITDRIKNTISGLLRNAYNSLSGLRGASDQSMRNYELINPIVLIGEESIIEPAIQERSLELSFGKTDLTAEARSSFKEIQENQGLIKKLGRTAILTALRIKPKAIKEIYEKAEKYINLSQNDFQSRVVNNASVIVAGLFLLKRILTDNELTIEECIGYDLDTLIKNILDGIKENVLSDNKNVTTIDSTIVIFDRMASQNKLIENLDYAFTTSHVGKEYIVLDVRLIYDKFTKYIKEYNLQEEIITNQAAFTKQLRKTSYFHKYAVARFKMQNEFNQIVTVSKKSYILDLEELNKKIELQKFIESSSFETSDDEDNPFETKSLNKEV